MEEYTELITKISGEMWKEFKKRIAVDMHNEEFWDEIIKIMQNIAEQYKGTIAEVYACEMAVFYLRQLQSIYRKEFKVSKRSDYVKILGEMAHG